ncbi:MAG: hypothetical protein E7035_07655 [Verrucomicrobiaceae bacterium]|nr:hypothetical protein [Verrucomicrobiaceae bacterium]
MNIKNKILTVLSFCFSSIAMAVPQKIIFDTDMGNDCDDVVAFQMLLSYVKSGKADLLCVAINKDNPYAPKFTRLISEFYGFDNLPIFMVKDGFAKEDGHFNRKTLEAKNPDGSLRFPLKNKDEKFEDSIRGLRKTLVAQPDNSVVYISVGFLSNIARLLQSQPDDISSLSGKELVAKKVKYISIMGGGFAPHKFWGSKGDKIKPEYNIKIDPPSSTYVLSNTPVDIVLSPFEVGLYLQFPYAEVMHGFYDAKNNPASFACNAYVYRIFERSKVTAELDRYMWDPSSVLYVFEPHHFGISVAGDVVLDKNAVTIFKPNPKGKIKYLILAWDVVNNRPINQRAIVNRCAELCRFSPKGK